MKGKCRNIYFCHSSQTPIKALPILRDAENDGSGAVSERGGGFGSAQSAKRSGWKRWWWPTLKWWSIMGAQLWRTTSWPSWTLWVALLTEDLCAAILSCCIDVIMFTGCWRSPTMLSIRYFLIPMSDHRSDLSRSMLLVSHSSGVK